MTKILYISSSVTGKNSFSFPLGKAIVEKLQLANPDNTLIEHNLISNPLPHITETHLMAFATTAGQRVHRNFRKRPVYPMKRLQN
jgi:FMN-dependent NADH-azoreductase